MKELIAYFKNKKNLINLLVLLVVVTGLPVLITLIQTQKIFLSRAAVDPIVFTGPNVTTLANNQRALKLNEDGRAVVDLELTSTLGRPMPQGANAEAPTEAKLAELPINLVPRGGLISEVKAQANDDLCSDEYGGGCWQLLGEVDYDTYPTTGCPSQFHDEGDGYCWRDCGPAACQEIGYSQATYQDEYSQSTYGNGYSQSTYGGGTQYSICGEEQANSPGYDYCNDPANGGFDDERYLCDIYNASQYGDGCYDNQSYLNQCRSLLQEIQCEGDQGNTTEYCLPSDPSTPPGCFQTGSTTNCYYDQAGTQEAPACTPVTNQSTCSTSEDPANYCTTGPGNHGEGSTCNPIADVASGATYGDGCTVVSTESTCTLKVNDTVITGTGQDNPENHISAVEGTPVRFEITASPPGANAVWNGSGQAVAPFDGNILNQPVSGYNPASGQTTYTWTGTYNLPRGNYTRIASIWDGSGTTVCNTGIAYIEVAPSTDAPMINTRNIARISNGTQSTATNPFRNGERVKITHQATNALHVDIHYINATQYPDPNKDSLAPPIHEGQAPNQEYDWTIPANMPAGKYWLVLNAHKDGAQHSTEDWLYAGEGCAWDGHLYYRAQPGSTELTDAGTCLNASTPLMPFWVGNPTASPSPSGQGCVGSNCSSPSPRASSGGYSQASYGGYSQASYGGYSQASYGGYSQASYGGYSQASYGGTCNPPNVRCPNGQCVANINQCPAASASPGVCNPPNVRCPNGQCVANANLCTNASPSPSGQGGVYTVAFRVAEDQATLDNTPYSNYDTEPKRLTFIFANSNPGPKTVWVDYKTNTNRVDRRSATINVLGPDPAITGCNISSSDDKSVTFNITGENFGATSGTIKSGTANLSIKSWSATSIQATLSNPPTGQSFPVNLTRSDGIKTDGQCSAIAQLSLGAKLFCRQPGKFDVAGVNLTLAEGVAGGRLIREVVTIDKNGIVQGLKAKLEEGKPYKLGIDVPKSVRKVVEFTAAQGTTNIPNLTLPVGDIFPIPDGDQVINSPDKSELNREWSIATDVKDRPGDFNQDVRVNSIDWACMRFDFGKSGDEEPKPGPISTQSGGGSTASPSPAASRASSPTPRPSASDRVCAQVVTAARNNTTQVCQEFPTPCAVPSGWTPIGGSSCPASPQPSASSSQSNTVTIDNSSFSPSTLNLFSSSGSPIAVTFINSDSIPHTATADDGSFDTGVLQPGQSASISIQGSHTYHCQLHPEMTGSIGFALP